MQLANGLHRGSVDESSNDSPVPPEATRDGRQRRAEQGREQQHGPGGVQGLATDARSTLMGRPG